MVTIDEIKHRNILLDIEIKNIHTDIINKLKDERSCLYSYETSEDYYLKHGQLETKQLSDICQEEAAESKKAYSKLNDKYIKELRSRSQKLVEAEFNKYLDLKKRKKPVNTIIETQKPIPENIKTMMKEADEFLETHKPVEEKLRDGTTRITFVKK